MKTGEDVDDSFPKNVFHCVSYVRFCRQDLRRRASIGYQTRYFFFPHQSLWGSCQRKLYCSRDISKPQRIKFPRGKLTRENRSHLKNQVSLGKLLTSRVYLGQKSVVWMALFLSEQTVSPPMPHLWRNLFRYRVRFNSLGNSLMRNQLCLQFQTKAWSKLVLIKCPLWRDRWSFGSIQHFHIEHNAPSSEA